VVQLARGNLAFGTGLMVLLMAGTVVCLPVVLPRILAGVEVNPWKIAQPLLFLMLLPLLAGLIAHAKFPSLPVWLRPSLGFVSNLSGLVVVVLIVALNFKSVLSVFGTGAIFAGVVFVVLSAWTGWLLGGPDRATGDPDVVNRASAMYGTPDAIAARLDELRKVGVGYVLVNGGGSGGGERGRASLRRFAREVMPAFADAMPTAQAAE